ncbi:MAG: nuclear transport factor 2 family protein [Saprospiraceae bacterium]|nr:nuclear transport factor 2 family protein [Saprospiraceae bacterium]
MIKKVIFLICIAIAVSVTKLNAQIPGDRIEIKEILDAQTEAWNKGDISEFMKTYWADDQLQFIGSNGPTFGYENTLQNYYKRYPDRGAMGKLHFDVLTINKRSRKVYSLIGKYHLERDKFDDLEGHFLLIIQKIKGHWKIVADSTH